MERPNTAQIRTWRQLGRELDADQMDAIFHIIDAFTEDDDESDEDSDDESDEEHDHESNVIPFNPE